MTGHLTRPDFITRKMVQDNRRTIYVFGDNMRREGLGGQAFHMRHEPNTIGVPTKWRPARDEGAYFCDRDYDNILVRATIAGAFDTLRVFLRYDFDVAIPRSGLGTGLSDLSNRAPKMHNWILSLIAGLQEDFEA